MFSCTDSSGLQALHVECFLELMSLEAITGNEVVLVSPNPTYSFHQPDLAKIDICLNSYSCGIAFGQSNAM